MKKGKWNYTEDIEYTVQLVKLLAVSEPKMSWQNAFVNQERQVVMIKHGSHQFLIDNSDGSGLLKIAKGGGPDSYSAHVSDFEFIRELPESEWQQFDQTKFQSNRIAVDAWQNENYPEEFKRMAGLREMIQSKNYHIDKNGTIVHGKK